MEQSEHIDKLSAALVKAQGLIRSAAMDGYNPFFKSRYATLGSVWDACREALQECGLAITQFPISGPGGWGVATTIVHTSGQWMRESLVIPLAKADAQGAGSAISYARRYALAAILGIVDEDDDDGNAASGKHEPATAPPKSQPVKPPAKPLPPPSEYEQVVQIGQGLIKHHVAKEGELIKEIKVRLNLPEKVKMPELPAEKRQECVQVATAFARERMSVLIEKELVRTGRTLEKAVVFLGHPPEYPANQLTPHELFRLADKLASIQTEAAA